MTAKQLIAKLQKMPQNAQVGIAAHDNSEWEVAGWATTIELLDKSETQPPDWVSKLDRECFDSLPKRTVVIRC